MASEPAGTLSVALPTNTPADRATACSTVKPTQLQAHAEPAALTDTAIATRNPHTARTTSRGIDDTNRVTWVSRGYADAQFISRVCPFYDVIAMTGRWSDPGVLRRSAGLSVIDGVTPAWSVVTAPSAI